MNKETGGAAFPTKNPRRDRKNQVIIYEEGMTLWDFFFNEQVAALITGLMARNRHPGYDGDDIMIYEAVRLGKIAADVMIAERAKEE